MFLQYVGFTGAPGFILAAVWILSFGSLLVVPLLQMESTRESQGIIIQYKKNLPQFTDSLYLCYCVIISNLPIRIHSLVVVVVPEIELVSYLKKKNNQFLRTRFFHWTMTNLITLAKVLNFTNYKINY